MDTPSNPEMGEPCQEHSSKGLGQNMLGSCLLKVRQLWGNTNHRDTLTTRASPPLCTFVLLNGFHFFCTAQGMAIFDQIIHNCLSESLQRQKIIFLIYPGALDVGPFLISCTKLSTVWCNRNGTHNMTCNE